MIKRIFTSFSLILILLTVTMSSCWHSPRTSPVGKWSYSVNNGIEKSERTYLLVYEPGTNKERRVTVVSRCEKPYPAEGTYGKCSHNVTVQPVNVHFNLATGEDIVMIQFTYDSPLILASIEYGCCGGPDTVKFFNERGLYLGFIEGVGVSQRANYYNLIARTFNMRNGTRYGEKIYLLVQTENKTKPFQAFVFEKEMVPNSIPVVVSISEREKCEDWYVEDFTAYGDRQGITLKLEGFFCRNTEDAQEQVFSCSVSEKAITCLPEEVKKTEGVSIPSTKRKEAE
jgi:hypothetical protein